MSPPLVVAFAIAGSILWDPVTIPLGVAEDGTEIYLKDLWPTSAEIASVMKYANDPGSYRRRYSDLSTGSSLWEGIASVTDDVYAWPKSTYIAEPPFFEDFSIEPAGVGAIVGARAIGIFGDSLTTDHISPAGTIRETTPAGMYLAGNGVSRADFQSYGTRRGNHEVMVRGTFANVRIRNLMLPQKPDGSRNEGGLTLFHPSGEQMSIYDAAMKYRTQGTPLIVFGGEEYGTGSSRDWAAKGTRLLGVRAVIAKSFERIHRANLVGMGVLPLQFMEHESILSLGIGGEEEFDILVPDEIKPQQEMRMRIKKRSGSTHEVKLLSRIDTAIEVDYYLHGGILQYVLRELMKET
jgi:aconitate hydratase